MSGRIRRSRIWRYFIRNMAAFTGLSALLFFCVSVSRISTNPVGRHEPERMDSSIKYTSKGEYILHYGENVASSVRLQRHNRALQFMDSKKYDISENIEAAELHDALENNQIRQGVFTDLNTMHELESKQLQVEIHSETSSKINNSLYPMELNFSNRSLQTQGLPTLSISQGESGNINKTISRNDTDISGKKNKLLDTVQVQSLSHEKEHKLCLNSTEVKSKRLPKAIIIGAKKAGTRALLEFLRLHPNVEGTGPEPHFFDRNYDKGLEWYRNLMPDTCSHQITIEKTPGYFVTRDAPKRVFEMDPSIKLILVVRDPVTRAISDYCQAVSKHAMRPFENMALLDQHLGLVNTSWGAIKIGVYAKHMEHWLQVFSIRQIHLVDGQKLIEEPAREVAKVETFLGLPKYINDSHFYLRGFKGTFPCLIREGKPHCLDEKTKGRNHPVVQESVIQRLRDFYRPFNAKFSQMVGMDFEWS